jgi:hypothetical protein
MDDIKKHQPPLQKLNKVIDWEIFRPILESALLNKNKAKGGRPPFDKILMFKIIILQRYFNISDDQTEFQIKDRLSFMDFLNLDLSAKILRNNFCLFRKTSPPHSYLEHSTLSRWNYEMMVDRMKYI